MILRLTVRDTHARSEQDVEVIASPLVTVGELLDVLPVHPAGRRCYVGMTELDRHARLAESPVLSGAVISVGGPAPVTSPSVSGAAGVLEVVSGADAGFVVALRPGRHQVSRDSRAAVPLQDSDVSRRHAQVEVARDEWITVDDVGSSNGTYVNGVRISRPTPLPPESELRIGNDVLRWVPASADWPRTARGADGRVEVHRGFAQIPVEPHLDVELPAEKTIVANTMAKVTSFLAPVGGAVIGVAASHSAEMAWMGALGLIGPAGFAISEGSQRARYRQAFLDRKSAVRTQISAHLEQETLARRQLAPGPADVARAATLTGPGLWTRRADAPNALTLRVGHGDAPASVTLHGEPWPGFTDPIVRDAPVTVDLRSIGVLGIIGPGEPGHALVRWLLLQLATHRSPSELRLVVITADDGESTAWTRWLPHLDPGASQQVACRIGNTEATRAARIEEIKKLISARRGERTWSGQETVLLLDGALALRQLPGVREILRDGPEVGVFVLCADQRSMAECHGICEVDAETLTLARTRDATAITARPEGITQATAERLARSLAPLHDHASSDDGNGDLPYPVRLLDLPGMPSPDADAVLASWSRSPGPTTRVVIGAGVNGPVTVDLARQGPHTMLGGATGAGKSILLRTLITALLLANRPDELNLVLVDFKGGSAFLPFEHCPHVTALIRSTGDSTSDVFDEAAAERTLASVDAEVHRRESLLARHNGEIDDYWRARDRDPSLPPLPRVVLVLDEFARVLETSPNFLKELVKVAAKGRSLGMHLVLSTQSLQGKLSAEMKANISLRISLRQNEPADSTEVLGVPDAATLPGPLRGRGMIRCTTDESPAPRIFQTGYLGDPPPAADHSGRLSARTVTWHELGAPRPAPAKVSGDAETDQSLVIKAIEHAARRLNIPAPHRPLLPALPAQLPSPRLADLATADSASTEIPYGLTDRPGAQAQPPAVLDLAGSDQLLVAGGPQSGRTTFARTLIASLAERFPPEQAHLYVIERHPTALAEAECLPHCGGVFAASESDRVRRLITWLGDEIRRRAQPQPDPVEPRPPAIVLVIDGWEHFESRNDPTRPETSLTRTLREIIATGSPLGVYVVAIGGQDMLSSKLANLYGQRVLLPFPNEQTRRGHLPSRVASPPLLPGRAVEASSGVHIQICQPEWPPSTSFDSTDLTRQPCRFPPLPALVTPDQLTPSQPHSKSWIPIGLGGPDTCPIGIDLFDAGPHLMLVSGPPGSGRTTTALTIIHALRRINVRVLAIAPPRSPIHRELATVPDVRTVEAITLDDADLRAAVAPFGNARYAIVVDDAEQLTLQPTREGFQELPTLLSSLIHPATLGQRALILTVDGTTISSTHRRSLSRPINETLTTGTRLLLNPADRAMAKDHGFTLEADQYFTTPPGRGYLSTGRDAELVQVALNPPPKRPLLPPPPPPPSSPQRHPDFAV